MDESTIQALQFLLVGCGWLTSATIGALIGRASGNVGSGALLGAFLGPLGWLVAACMKDDRQDEVALLRKSVKRDGKWVLTMMKCPQCAEVVKAEALKCRFCGHEFRPESLKLVSNPSVSATLRTTPPPKE